MLSTLLLSTSILACAANAPSDPPGSCEAGGKCDGADPSATCDDPRYGDGVCQTDLACAAPDIDCFTIFSDDTAAAAWYATYEAHVAQEQGRPPRPMLAAADPRYVQARDLLDRGWAAFQRARPVGALAQLRPSLVVLEDSEVNAFVAPDKPNGRAGFAVMVQTGLLASGGSDDAMLGVMMHELQHAIGLHVIEGTSDRLRKFYLADPGAPEPIGREQPVDPRADVPGHAWREAASLAGPYNNPELGGFTMSGDLDRLFMAVAVAGREANPDACAHSIDLINPLRQEATGNSDPLSGAMHLDGTFESRAATAMAALRDECLPGDTDTFYQAVARIAGAPPEAIAAQMSPEDRALVEGKHVIDAIWALASAHRATEREVEAQFETATGLPWSTMRFFSIEEDADDTSVLVLRAAQLDPTGIGTFLLGSIAPPECAPVLATGVMPPYGVDLNDEHHETCWRVGHAHEFAEHTAPGAASRLAPARTPSHVARPRLLPPTWSEQVIY